MSRIALISLVLLVVSLGSMGRPSLADTSSYRPAHHVLRIMHSGATAHSKLIRLEQTVQRLRHLKQLHTVRVVFLRDKQFERTYSSLAHKGTTETDIRVSQMELDLLGLLKPSLDLHKILFANLSAQIGGFYDDHVKDLFVRNHANQVLGIRRDLIAHEYTHALQDQHYNLLKLTPDLNGVKYRNSDAWAAHKALIEGDAVNTQYLFIFNTYSRAELAAFAREQANLPKTPKLPTSIQREFDFQYTVGLKFVQTLYARGHAAAIDKGFARLPSSTYEIMHPTAYLSGWRPVTVSLHAVKGFEGWKRLDDDVFGAFGYNLLLWQSLPKSRADRVTDSWRGDRYVFLQNGRQEAMVLKSVWANARAAAAAGTAMVAAIHSQYGQRPLRHNLISLPNGAAYVHARGSQLTVVYATSATLATKAGTAPTS